MHSLRRKLQAMTEMEDVSRHPHLLDALTRECPNTIRLLNSPHPIQRYTCLVHVLDFTQKEEYELIASPGFHVVFAGRAFAYRLIDRGSLVEITQLATQPRDFIFYFDEDGQFKHAGLILGNERAQSKWGVGHLYDHELFDVPESYGSSARFFKNLPYDQALDCFVDFAKEKGMLL
jgi:hypothetical protein